MERWLMSIFERTRSERSRTLNSSPFHLLSMLPGDYHQKERSPCQSQDLTGEKEN